MTVFGMIVCIAVLVAVGYFVFAVLGEAALWAYNRLTRTVARQTTTTVRVVNHKYSV